MSESNQKPDAFGILAYLLYVAVGGFLVFGFAWAIQGAVDVQNEAICRALHPEHRNRIEGTVVDDAGQPVAGAEVVPVVDDKPGAPMKAGKDGAFEVFLPEGTNSLLVRAPQKAALEIPMTLGREQSVDLQITMAAEGQGDGDWTELGRTVFEAPDTVLEDLEGNEVHLSDFRGKFVIVNFWATWCEPCITEWPQVDQLAGRLGDRDDVVILAISMDEKKEDIVPFLQKMGLDQTRVKVLWDPQQNFRVRFGTTNIPDTYFVDENGTVLHAYVNVRKWGAPEAFHCVDGMAGRAS